MSTVEVATDQLTAAEREELRSLEADIEAGAQAFVQMGSALKSIRDKRLYRGTHGTFEAYCRAQWKLSGARAYQFIDAAETAKRLSTIVEGLAPRSESVARELSPLRDDPDAQAAAMSEAVKRHGPSPTAKQVREVVRPQAPGDDTRFELFEDMWSSAQGMPAPERMPWPVEAGDVEVLDEVLANLKGWAAKLPEYARLWRLHKRELRGMRAVN